MTKHRDGPTLISTAADELTRVYGPQWPHWVNLWQLNMYSMKMCALAQVETGSGLPPLVLNTTPFVSGLRRLYWSGVSYSTTRAFISGQRADWKREVRRRRKESTS